MTAKGAEKSPQYHRYFIQYSAFASERLQVRTLGRQTWLLPRGPSNLITPLFDNDIRPVVPKVGGTAPLGRWETL